MSHRLDNTCVACVLHDRDGLIQSQMMCATSWAYFVVEYGVRHAHTHSTHHLRLDEAVTIMEYTGDTSIIQAMAHRLGGVFTRVDDEATQASIIMTALSTSACQGDIMSEMQKALEDGRIDCNERDALQTKIQDAMVALRTLSVQITNHCEGNNHV